MKQYVVAVYEEGGWDWEQFRTLIGALKHAAKFVRLGHEVRIQRTCKIKGDKPTKRRK